MVVWNFGMFNFRQQIRKVCPHVCRGHPIYSVITHESIPVGYQNVLIWGRLLFLSMPYYLSYMLDSGIETIYEIRLVEKSSVAFSFFDEFFL